MLTRFKESSHLFSIGLIITAFFLWIFSCIQARNSLVSGNLNDLTQIGLFSILPLSFYVAFSLLLFSFFITLLFTKNNRFLLIVCHTLLLVLLLNFTPAFVEGTARFTTSYLNYQATDYILQTEHLNPISVWIHNWPSFSIVVAAFAQITCIPGQLILLVYPTIINFLIVICLFVFFRLVLQDFRLIWLSIWFVLLGNWVGQDYFSMQSLAFVFVILILFLLFKNMTQKAPVRQWAIMLLLLFFFVVSSHLLSSLAIFCVILLLFLSKSMPRFGLVAIIATLIAGWTIINAIAYLTKSLPYTFEQALNFTFIFTTNLTNRMGGDFGHIVTTNIRLIYSIMIFAFAFVGIFSVFLTRKATTTDKRVLFVLLGFALLIFAFAYGGELFMRFYMFSLIPLAYFASKALLKYKRFLFVGLLFSIIFVPSFVVISQYGNESIDYVPYSETIGVIFLYGATEGGQVVGGSIRSSDFRDFKYRFNYEELSLRDLYLSNRSNTLFTQAHDPYLERFVCVSYETSVFFSSYMGDKTFLSRMQENLSQSISYNLVYSNPSFEIYNSKPLN